MYKGNICWKNNNFGVLRRFKKLLRVLGDIFKQKYKKELRIATVDEHDFTNYLLLLSKKIKVTMKIVDSMLFLSDMWLTKIVQFRCCLFMINFASHKRKSQALFILLTFCYQYKLRPCLLFRLFSDCAKFPCRTIFRNKEILPRNLYIKLLDAKYYYLREHLFRIIEPYSVDIPLTLLSTCIICGEFVLWQDGNFFNCICCSSYFRRYALELIQE